MVGSAAGPSPKGSPTPTIPCIADPALPCLSFAGSCFRRQRESERERQTRPWPELWSGGLAAVGASSSALDSYSRSLLLGRPVDHRRPGCPRRRRSSWDQSPTPSEGRGRRGSAQQDCPVMLLWRLGICFSTFISSLYFPKVPFLNS